MLLPTVCTLRKGGTTFPAAGCTLRKGETKHPLAGGVLQNVGTTIPPAGCALRKRGMHFGPVVELLRDEEVDSVRIHKANVRHAHIKF